MKVSPAVFLMQALRWLGLTFSMALRDARDRFSSI